MLRVERQVEDSIDLRISRMTEHDLLEVVEIEEASGLSRWGWEAYHTELRQETGRLMFVSRRPGAVSTRGAKSVSGFIASRLVGDELHVNNVAVRDTCRRMGIGTKLLEHVLREAQQAGVHQAFLEVRASNDAARALYSRCGFRVTGQRRNYYSDPVEDALLMRRGVDGSA